VLCVINSLSETIDLVSHGVSSPRLGPRPTVGFLFGRHAAFSGYYVLDHGHMLPRGRVGAFHRLDEVKRRGRIRAFRSEVSRSISGASHCREAKTGRPKCQSICLTAKLSFWISINVLPWRIVAAKPSFELTA
jgi:hypothetical protein